MPSCKLQIGMAQSWPASQYDTLYMEGARKFPDALRMHQAAMEYYTPRWFGSDEKLTWFIERVVAMTKAKHGQMFYTRLHNGADSSYTQRRDDWPRRKAGFTDMVKRYPGSWNASQFAEYACLARDLPVLKAQLTLLKGEPDPLAWRQPRMIAHCSAAEQTDKTLRAETGQGWSKY